MADFNFKDLPGYSFGGAHSIELCAYVCRDDCVCAYMSVWYLYSVI